MRPVGRPTGLRNVMFVKVTLLYPGLCPTSRSAVSFVLPEPVNQLAVLGQAGPEIWNVTIFGGTVVFPWTGSVEPIDRVVCTSGTGWLCWVRLDRR